MVFNREKVLQEAQKYTAKGRLDRAVVEYQKLVKANPGDDRSMLKIAELQTRMKAYDAAISTYEQLAAHYASQGFAARAMAIYKQIRGLIQEHLPNSKGHYGPVVNKLAALYIEAGLKGDAVATYQEYAAHLQRAGREDELLPIYRELVQLKEEDFEIRNRLIQALRAQGLQEEADDHLLAYGERLVHLGRIDEGVVALDEVVQRRTSDAALARRVADLYLDRNGPGDAMVALMRMQTCFQSTKRDIETLRVLARAFSLIGQRPKAIEVRKLMVKIAKDNGDIEIAQALVNELLEDCPKEPGVRELAASVYPGRVMSSVPPSVPPSVPMPEVEVAPASVSFSEESFEVEESIQELGDDLLEQVSSFPPPQGKEPKVLASFGPPAGRRPIPPPPPPRVSKLAPPPPPLGSQGLSPLPSPLPAPFPAPDEASPDVAGLTGDWEKDFEDEFTADYDAMLVGEGPEVDGEPTPPHFHSDPASLPPPDFLAEDFADGEEGLGMSNVNGFETRPAIVTEEPEYEVDDGLEEALDEADFFVSQGLYDDALSLLQDLIPRYPGHPLLIQRMQSVRAAKGTNG